MALRVCEIFRSIQGETTRAGFPSLFIRLAGCNLNCAWCDTPDARGEGGIPLSVERVAEIAAVHRDVDHVTVTGGEPLLQQETSALIAALPAGLAVQVETNGSLPLEGLPPGTRVIMDVKTPSSGEEGSLRAANIPLLGTRDEIKFVIADEGDYRFAKSFMERSLRACPATVNLSPARGRMDPAALCRFVIEDRLMARINLQLHAIVWGADRGTGEGEQINLANIRP